MEIIQIKYLIIDSLLKHHGKIIVSELINEIVSEICKHADELVYIENLTNEKQ